ncbi:GH1 family beta-glucosidase [Pseudarthrobacter sp. R1]|uniref:GH1 family beta-glucosidase n=1 Tax=Pseudarthrobacter sp. R1 TaxID=2944934 RepID=UPI00210EBFFC|nr:GH1 family beta-glucosidase [Pseudarthrobacter sp. R1]MCQ6272310.1 GH1 family beta-glucosidase [Pseudarthrobacter sp. R1]
MTNTVERLSGTQNLANHRIEELVFPAGFVFGLSSSCNQTEGAVTQGGKGVSIWDTFTQKPGAIVDGSTQERAIDHYNRFDSDFDMLAAIGPDTYRPSIAWSRVDPLGDGVWNEEALTYYSDVIDKLIAIGVDPWVTLYHWDMPQALQDRGGWESRETVQRFTDYALKVQDRLGDRVKRWTTFEEPSCVALFGYGSGKHAPGITSPTSALRAAHHVLLAHGNATKAMKAARPDNEVGIALVLTPIDAASTSSKDLDAARRADLVINRFFIEPILTGGYADDAVALIQRYTDASHIQPGDAELIATPIDFLGVNYYFREYAKWDPSHWNAVTPNIGCEDVVMVKSGAPQTLSGWEIDHHGLYDALMRVHHLYPAIPIYITEAGASFDYEVAPDGAVHDINRVEYLANQFAMAQHAVRSGVNLRGFCVWTFMDNWEWAAGWTQRFGLVHVDRDSLERRYKDSAYWFGNLIRHNTPAERQKPEMVPTATQAVP